MTDLNVLHVLPNGYWDTNSSFVAYDSNEPLSISFNRAVKDTDKKYIVRIDGGDTIPEYFFQYGLYLTKSLGIAISPVYLMLDYWKRVWEPQGAGIFYEREKFLEIGGYDESLDFQADLDFYIRYTRKYKIHTETSLIYPWKVNGGRSLTNKDKILGVRKQILDKYGMKDDEVYHFGSYAYV